MIDLGVVAGEASGDLLGAHFIGALAARHPGLAAAGIAGPRMTGVGVAALVSSERLAVNGLVEVLGRLPELLWIRARMARYFLAERPRVFVGIDAPDFNFALEARLKRAGIPTVHFVSPSLWAWRGERIHTIARAVSHMLVVFPFEVELYREAGVPVTFVGHPLADVIPPVADTAAARASLGVPRQAVVVALLPGSRANEVSRLAPLMLDAAAAMRRARPDLHFLVPAANDRAAMLAERAAAASGVAVQIVAGRSHDVLAACDVALVASGTATLEAALFKKPMVITYRVPRLTAAWMRRQARLPWIGLPNILAGRSVVPELVQEAATPQALARETLAWLDDAGRYDATVDVFRGLHAALRQNAEVRIADALEPFLAARR